MSKGRQIRICAALCALAALPAGARAAEKRQGFPENPRFTVQRVQDQEGMGAITANALGQKAQGFLWIGTQTGLYRYDGTRAKKMPEVESIIGHYVVDLLIAPDGTPWFAGTRGIAFYKDGQFQKLEIPASSMPLLNGVQIFAVDGRGIVYALTYKRGLLKLDPKNPGKTETIAQGLSNWDTPEGIVRSVDDSIWLTAGRSLVDLNAGSRQMEVESGIRLPNERVVALQFDGIGMLWLRTATRLARVDLRDRKLIFEEEVAGEANEEEGKPSVDAEGKLLVPRSAGLYWQQNGQWRLGNVEHGLASDLNQLAREDREGTLREGGSGTGLDRLTGVREWSAWTTAGGLPDKSTWTTLRDRQGRVWVRAGNA